jgi:hypothetical protein
VSFETIGSGTVTNGSHTITATLETMDGGSRAEARQDLGGATWLALPLPVLEPAEYRLRLTVRDAEGRACSELAQPVSCLAGPLF